MPSVSTPVRFGAFELDGSSGELRRNGFRVHLSEQPLQILNLLVEHPGQLVTREELRKRLWSEDTFVDFEHGLNAAVKRLREALGDSAEHPRYIETIPRRGYRFISEVVQAGPPVNAQVEQALTSSSQSSWRFRLAGVVVAAVLIAAAAGVFAWMRIRARSASAGTNSPLHTIAVLPFLDMSPEKDQQYFSDGLTEELSAALAKIPELRVSARTSSFQFKGKDEDMRVIGQKLNVRSILEGSVRKEKSRLRITVQLINASDGYHIWSETYDRDISDIFAVQEEIGRSVAEALKVSLLQASSATNRSQSKNVEAYKAFLQARYFSERRSQEDMEKSVRYYETALKLNPEDARSWAGLAEAHTHQADTGFVGIQEGYGKARNEVERALRLDPNLAKAHQVMGWIKMTHDWDYTGAEASFRRALMLEPGDATTIWEIGALMTDVGKYKEALDFNQRSVEMDPLSPSVYLFRGSLQYIIGKYDDAISSFQKAIELNPDFPVARAYMCEAYLMNNQPDLALQAAQEETQVEWKRVALALAYWKLGKSQEADGTLQELIAKDGWSFAYQVAEIYAYRGEADKAFDWLERAYAQRDSGVSGMKGDPLMRKITSDQRYLDFVKKVGLPM